MLKILTLLLLVCSTVSGQVLDWRAVEPDLQLPQLTDGQPAAGKRVRMTRPECKGSELYHVLYLPTDWKPDESYPVIVEYAGNRHPQGDGSVESCKLGYGISGGKGVIWLCLPFVDSGKKANAPKWWGDADATVDYCKKVVAQVCEDYGGDPAKVLLAGFSRGSIACNFIGLHDDEIAKLWCGFICHSHYEGVREWPQSDAKGAAERLKRLGDRLQWISHESSIEPTRNYLKKTKPGGNFTFVTLPFPEHTDHWVLRDIAPRKELREWFRAVSASIMWKRDRNAQDFEVLRNHIKKGASIPELDALLGDPDGVTQDDGFEYYEYLTRDHAGRSFAWSATIDRAGRFLEWDGPTDP